MAATEYSRGVGNDLDRDLLVMTLILAGLLMLLVVLAVVERRLLDLGPGDRTPGRPPQPPGA